MTDFSLQPAAPAVPAARPAGKNPPRVSEHGEPAPERVAGIAVPRSIEWHIGEVVLEGMAGINRAEFGLALQTELEDLLARRGLPRGFSDFSGDRMDGGVISYDAGMEARVLARRVAQAVYGGLIR